jgi:hypothetical protein
VTYSDPEWLYTVSYPEEWDRFEGTMTSLGQRRNWEMLSLGSFELNSGDYKCAQIPERALRELSPTDAFVTIQEPEGVAESDLFPPRPESFSLDLSTRTDNVYEIFDCLQPTQDFGFEMIPFSDGGRKFYAYVAVGLQAAPERINQVLQVLDSLEILPGGSEPPVKARRDSCRDESGDVLGEGSGDMSGPAAQPPPKPQSGTDLERVLVNRQRSSMTVSFTAFDPIPMKITRKAILAYVLTAVERGPNAEVAAIHLRLDRDRWSVEVGEEEKRRVLSVEPSISGDVIEVQIGRVDIPELMTRNFRWNARSDWVPTPTIKAAEMYADFCPEGLRFFS